MYELEEPKLMIKKSKELGLFATKFQLFNESLVEPELYPWILDLYQANELFQYGQEIGQEVFFTPMYDCIEFLEQLGINYYKIRFKDRFNIELTDKIVATNKPYFRSVELWDKKLSDKEISLFCMPKYPATFIDYYNYYNLLSGVSDHTSCSCLLELSLQKTCWFKVKKRSYFEKHVRLRDGTFEDEWSITFDQLRRVLEKNE